MDATTPWSPLLQVASSPAATVVLFSRYNQLQQPLPPSLPADMALTNITFRALQLGAKFPWRTCHERKLSRHTPFPLYTTDISARVSSAYMDVSCSPPWPTRHLLAPGQVTSSVAFETLDLTAHTPRTPLNKISCCLPAPIHLEPHTPTWLLFCASWQLQGAPIPWL